MDEGRDWCGAEGGGWKAKIVPDTFRKKYYIGHICRIHDGGYAVGGNDKNRLSDDIAFRKGIYNTLKKQGMWWPGRLFYSRVYYRAVRKFGYKHFNYNNMY